MSDHIPFREPELGESSFNCPHCRAYSHQRWGSTSVIIQGTSNIVDDSNVAFCSRCGQYSLWVFRQMVYPDYLPVLPPNPDLNDDIKADYREAASIIIKSPRGAAALLRLCIQKTCKQLGESGENINDDIKNLVKKGLSPTLQKALDVVRVIGNESVHPGQIDLNDTPDTAYELFKLVNIIADVMISQPKKIEELYETLPKDKREAIEKRDGSSA